MKLNKYLVLSLVLCIFLALFTTNVIYADSAQNGQNNTPGLISDEMNVDTTIDEAEKSIEVVSLDTASEDCKTLEELRQQIDEKQKSFREKYNELKKNLNNNKNKLLKLRREFTFKCIKNDVEATGYNADETSSMTGNVIAASALRSKIVNLKEKYHAMPTTSVVESHNFADMLVKIKLIEEEAHEVDSTNLETPVCEELSEDIKSTIKRYNELANNINDFLEENKDLIDEIKNLIESSQELSEKCYKIKGIKLDCKVDQELLDERNRLEQELDDLYSKKMELRNNNPSDSNNQEVKDLYNNEIEPLREKLQAINSKIYAIKASCSYNNNFVNNKVDVCQDKIRLMTTKEKLLDQLESTTDEEDIAALKRKIEYYEEKIDSVVCLTEASIKKIKIGSKVKPTDSKIKLTYNKVDLVKASSDTVKNIKLNLKNVKLTNSDFVSCIENYVKQDNVTKEVASYACEKKYEFTNNKLKELNQKLKEQMQTINKLKSNINKLRGNFKEKTAEEKLVLLEENAEVVLEHSIARIDSLILKAKTYIEKMETISLDESRKEQIIDNLNDYIAKLDSLREDLLDENNDAETIKEYLVEARNIESLIIKDIKYVSFVLSLNKLQEIVDSYFEDETMHADLQSDIDDISKELLDAYSNEDENLFRNNLDSIKAKYNKLKAKLRSATAKSTQKN